MKKLYQLLLATIACASFGASAAPNLIANGGFEDGSAAGYASFYSDYIKNGNLYDPSIVTIGSNPASYHGAWASFGALEGNNMLIVNGGIDGTQNLIWGQTLHLAAGNYDFSAAAASSYPQNPGMIFAIVTVNGHDYNMGFVLLGGTVGHWETFGSPLSLQAASTVDLKLYNLNTEYSGNDFVIDKIMLTSAVPEPASYALLLAGLGMLGIAARRRKQGVRRPARCGWRR